MKIYKIAQEIIEQEQEMGKSKYRPTYIDIGHVIPYSLWIYYNGHLETKDVAQKDVDDLIAQGENQEVASMASMAPFRLEHGDLWDFDKIPPNNFSGRYDNNGKLSIHRSGELNRNRPVPEFLFKILKEKFTNVQKIYVF